MAGDIGTDDTMALPAEGAESLGEPPVSRLRPGEIVDRYVVEALLGSGGMAEVYRARDQRLGRAVALKLVRPVREGEMCGSLCSLLMREARTLAKLSNPSILTVHDVGEHHGCVYLAMELIEGSTLRDWAANVESWRERLRILLETGNALGAAHAAKVVHRDVKPENILVRHSGGVVVSDFGVARSLADLDDQGHQCGCAGGATIRVDLEGKVVGTPHYMSPEQHQGLAADSRSDQFSFAVTCWEILHGTLPFAGDDIASIRENVLAHRVLPAPSGTVVPEPVSAALRRGMKTSPSARYPNMEGFVESLSRSAPV
jgi:serine/threonine protein kinase